nr:MFS transporter [Streptomyces coryli]
MTGVGHRGRDRRRDRDRGRDRGRARDQYRRRDRHRHRLRDVPPVAARGRLRSEIAAGLRHVFAGRELRALAFTATLSNLGAQMVNAMLPVLFTRELGLPAGALGAYWAMGGAGILLGAACARRLAGRLGHGRTLAQAGLWLAPAGLGVALIGDGLWLWLASAAWLLTTTKMGIDNVLGVTLRQHLTPDDLLGRMNATFRFMLTGALAIGSALAGLIGEAAGVRAAVWAGGVCLSIAFLPVFCSPLRRLRELPPLPGPTTTKTTSAASPAR